ncbi:MAG: hypothetical protein NTY50_05075 [Methylobacter sp.]|nr:hypothetical protein [Methylobacter sp.]
MKKITVGTLVFVGSLAAANVDAAVNADQVQNNVLRRIVGEAQQSMVMGDKNVIQEWQQTWAQAVPPSPLGW